MKKLILILLSSLFLLVSCNNSTSTPRVPEPYEGTWTSVGYFTNSNDTNIQNFKIKFELSETTFISTTTYEDGTYRDMDTGTITKIDDGSFTLKYEKGTYVGETTLINYSNPATKLYSYSIENSKMNLTEYKSDNTTAQWSDEFTKQ